MKNFVNVDLINKYLKENKMTKKELCKKSKISVTVLHKILNDKNFAISSIFVSSLQFSEKTPPAIWEISFGKPPFGSKRLMPIPSTAKGLSFSKTPSVKIPQTFLPFRKMSLTHLIFVFPLATCSIAFATLTAAAVVIRV